MAHPTPGWYQNLAKDPQVELQVEDRVLSATRGRPPARNASNFAARRRAMADYDKYPEEDRSRDSGRRARARLTVFDHDGATTRALAAFLAADAVVDRKERTRRAANLQRQCVGRLFFASD